MTQRKHSRRKGQKATRPRLCDLLPPLLPEEYERLKASIASRGYVGEPTIVDQKNETVDGFHRQKACDELQVFCPREIRHFTTDWEKYELAVRLNCRRRQLTTTQKRDVIKTYLRCDPRITPKHLADIIGVSQNTVAKVREQLIATFQIEKFDKLRGRDGKERPTKYKRIVINTAKELEQALKDIHDLPDNCNGKMIDVTSANRRAKRHRTKLERERRIEQAKVSVLPDNITITHTDFRDIDIEPGSMDLILTGVMWSETAKADWRALGERAVKWLKPDGLLATYIGQNHLLAMANAIAAGGLYIQSIFAGLFPPGSNAAEINGIVSRWRPVVVFARQQHHVFRKTIDTFDVGPPEKDWSWLQQTVQGARWLLEHLSDPGAVVLDPCLGTGTNALAVLTASDGPRMFIGCDRDEQMITIAHQRIADEIAKLTKPS